MPNEELHQEIEKHIRREVLGVDKQLKTLRHAWKAPPCAVQHNLCARNPETNLDNGPPPPFSRHNKPEFIPEISTSEKSEAANKYYG